MRIRAFKIDFSLIQKVSKRGVPEAFTQLATPVTALCYNLMLSSRIGDIGVSTFSVLSYVSSLANAILSGVAQGLQPLWGRCYGSNDTDEMKWFFHRGMVINAVLSVGIFGILFFFDVQVIHIFNKEPELVQTATTALPPFALSFVPMAFNLIYTAFLFSTKRTAAANVVAISRGIVLKALAISLIPVIAGTNAIWIAPFVAESVTLMIAIFIRKTGT